MRHERAPQVSLVLGTSTGGVGAHVLALVRGLAGEGFRVRVCGPGSTDELFGFSRAGAEFAPVHIAGAARDPLAVTALRKLTSGSCLVHAHGLRAGTVSVLAGRRPLIVTWHNAVLAAPSPRRAVLEMGERIVAHGATLTLAASEDLADRVRVLGGRDVRYAPVAVEQRAPSRSVADVRRELAISADQLLVMSIGRLHHQKGHDILVTAAARWSALDVTVVIAGDGPLHASLAAQIDTLRAPVRLLGRREDIADLLAAADLVVLPSRWEARALAAQEALLAARPLVASAVGGLPALLGAGADLVPAEDVDALDAAVRGLLTDPRRRAELAARGAERAAGWPTERDTLTQVAAIYRELLGTA